MPAHVLHSSLLGSRPLPPQFGQDFEPITIPFDDVMAGQTRSQHLPACHITRESTRRVAPMGLMVSPWQMRHTGASRQASVSCRWRMGL